MLRWGETTNGQTIAWRTLKKPLSLPWHAATGWSLSAAALPSNLSSLGMFGMAPHGTPWYGYWDWNWSMIPWSPGHSPGPWFTTSITHGSANMIQDDPRSGYLTMATMVYGWLHPNLRWFNFPCLYPWKFHLSCTNAPRRNPLDLELLIANPSPVLPSGPPCKAVLEIAPVAWLFIDNPFEVAG